MQWGESKLDLQIHNPARYLYTTAVAFFINHKHHAFSQIFTNHITTYLANFSTSTQLWHMGSLLRCIEWWMAVRGGLPNGHLSLDALAPAPGYLTDPVGPVVMRFVTVIYVPFVGQFTLASARFHIGKFLSWLWLALCNREQSIVSQPTESRV